VGRALSAPLFHYDPLPGPGDTRIRLAGPEGHHAATVRRMRAGERLDLGDGRGALLRCRVLSAGGDGLDLVVEDRTLTPAPAPRLVVAQALAKGERSELAVAALTEVGVDEIVPWTAQRSVVRWSGERGARALERWRSTARESAKQARRPWWPVVSDPVDTATLAERCSAATLALVLDAAGPTPLADVSPPGSGEIVLVVGPEGGLSDDELARLGPAHRLGPDILRTSTAGAVAAGVVLSRTARWR
jgi:16S rRNA (uracil1498-N3)-methyltransferase